MTRFEWSDTVHHILREDGTGFIREGGDEHGDWLMREDWVPIIRTAILTEEEPPTDILKARKRAHELLPKRLIP